MENTQQAVLNVKRDAPDTLGHQCPKCGKRRRKAQRHALADWIYLALDSKFFFEPRGELSNTKYTAVQTIERVLKGAENAK